MRRWAARLPLLMLALLAACERPRTVAGTVRDHAGQPLSGETVTLSFATWGISRGQLVWDKVRAFRAVTAADGGYRIAYVGPGDALLTVRWHQQPTGGRARVDIVVPPSPPPLVAEPRTWRTGEPWASFFCEALAPGLQLVSVRWQGGALALPTVAYAVPDLGLVVPARTAAVTALAAEVELRGEGNHLLQKGARTLEPGCAGLVLLAFADPARPEPLTLLLPSARAGLTLRVRRADGGEP